MHVLVAKIQPEKVVRLCADGEFYVLYFQRVPRSIFQTCILNSHEGHTMCGSMTDIQYAMAENRQGKKRKKEER